MKKYYETLEFSMIQKAIKNYCFSEMAKHQVDALKPYHDLDDLKLYQDDVFHAMTIIYAYGRIPLAPYEDIEEIIQKAQKGGVCYPQDFLKIIQIFLRSSLYLLYKSIIYMYIVLPFLSFHHPICTE